MKKIITLMLTIAMVITALTGCNLSKDKVTVNKEYSSNEMKTIQGETITFDEDSRRLASKSMGFMCMYPESWKTIDRDKFNIMQTEDEIYIGYIPQSVLTEAMNLNTEDMTEEELMEKATELLGKTFSFMCIYQVVEGNSALEAKKTEIDAKYETVNELVKNDKTTYYVAYNTTIPTKDFDETDTKESQNLIDSIETLKDGVILFPIVNEEDSDNSSANFKGNLNKFTALDTKGNTVTQDIFADYDITMVNIWTTWCGVCVKEMPELAEMYKDLPENVNLISICGDGAAEPELTDEILKKSGVTFTTLVENEEINNQLTQYVTAYPTTVFIDNKGNVVGSIQVGAPGKDVITGYTNLINDALSTIKK